MPAPSLKGPVWQLSRQYRPERFCPEHRQERGGLRSMRHEPGCRIRLSFEGTDTMAVPSIETSIFQAILARVETLPMLADYPLHWSDGPAYEPQVSQPYLRATWLPNRTRRLFLNGADPHQRPGILQIDVFGRVDFGAGVAKEVAGQIAAHFPADYRMSFGTITARVTAAPSLGPVFIETHIQVPTSIEIETYA